MRAALGWLGLYVLMGKRVAGYSLTWRIYRTRVHAMPKRCVTAGIVDMAAGIIHKSGQNQDTVTVSRHSLVVFSV